MQDPITYSIDHSMGTVSLTVTPGRFVARTQGKGLLDKPRNIDIQLSDLRHFCVVPTIALQHLVSPLKPSSYAAADYSYDSEFIFSYQEGARLKKKSVFVNSRDESFQMLLENLRQDRPSASLLHLDPEEAQRQMGTISARKGVYIVVGLLVGVPILIAIIVIVSKIFGG